MRRILPRLAVLCMAFAPAPFPRPDATGPADRALRGEWVLVSETNGGLKQAPRKLSLVFFRRHAEKTAENWKDRWDLDLDGASTPKAFDLRVEGCLEPYRLKHVYRVEGDTLVTCSHINKPSLRPSDLSGNARWCPCIQVFKRKK